MRDVRSDLLPVVDSTVLDSSLLEAELLLTSAAADLSTLRGEVPFELYSKMHTYRGNQHDAWASAWASNKTAMDQRQILADVSDMKIIFEELNKLYGLVYGKEDFFSRASLEVHSNLLLAVNVLLDHPDKTEREGLRDILCQMNFKLTGDLRFDLSEIPPLPTQKTDVSKIITGAVCIFVGLIILTMGAALVCKSIGMGWEVGRAFIGIGTACILGGAAYACCSRQPQPVPTKPVKLSKLAMSLGRWIEQSHDYHVAIGSAPAADVIAESGGRRGRSLA